MLMPYLVLYRLSKWFSLDAREAVTTEAVLDFGVHYLLTVLDSAYDANFDLRLSSPRQPGHGFLSLVYAMQRRQFIPQGAISFVEIAVVFVDLFDVMSRSCRGYVSTSLLKPNTELSQRRSALFRDWLQRLVSRLQQSHHEISQYHWSCFLRTAMQERSLAERRQ